MREPANRVRRHELNFVGRKREKEEERRKEKKIRKKKKEKESKKKGKRKKERKGKKRIGNSELKWISSLLSIGS